MVLLEAVAATKRDVPVSFEGAELCRVGRTRQVRRSCLLAPLGEGLTPYCLAFPLEPFPRPQRPFRLVLGEASNMRFLTAVALISGLIGSATSNQSSNQPNSDQREQMRQQAESRRFK